MDRNGLSSTIDRIVSLNHFDWAQRKEVQQTKEYTIQVAGQATLLSEFKKIGKSNDIRTLIKTEQLITEQEKRLYGSEDKAVMPSLTAASKDFDVINSSIETVQSPEAYQAAAATYHAKRKIHGVVTDGCHEALNSHITRLGNRMSAIGVSVPEKNTLRQRQSNMRRAKELYIELQCKALGLPRLEKSPGLKR